MLRLQVPRVRMADGWALGKFGGEFGQGTQTYAGGRTGAIFLVISEVGQLQSSLFLRALRTELQMCPFVAPLRRADRF